MYFNDTQTGISSIEEVQALVKALEAPQSMDDFTGRGIGPVTRQSLENTLVMLTFKDSHLALWKDIPKGSAKSTIEQYARQLGHGLSEGGWVSQLENPEYNEPDLDQKFSVVKFLREGWQAGDVAELVDTITSSEVLEKQSATQRLLRRLSGSLYGADSEMSQSEIDGLEAVIKRNGSPDHIIDLRGNYPDLFTFNAASQLILEVGLGNPNGAKLYCSPGSINAINEIVDRKSSSDTLQRYISGIVGKDGKISIGHEIDDIKTTFGKLIPRIDIMLGQEYENKGVPKIRDKSNSDSQTLIEGATSTKAPARPNISITANTSVNGSRFTIGTMRPAGETYKYRVCARNRFGRSIACDPAEASAAVDSGGANSITITPGSGTYPVEYFEIFSEQVAGSGIFQYLGKIKADGNNPVTFDDKNEDIPGTGKMFIVDFTAIGADRTILFKQLAPLHSQTFGKVGPFNHGNINFYGMPIYYKPLCFVMIKNVPINTRIIDNRIMM